MSWTPEQLCEYLDIESARIVEEAKTKAGLDTVTFAGTVTGFLLKTAFALAAKHGMPRSVLESQIGGMIRSAWVNAARKSLGS